jgi:hypothetical protein
MYIVPKNCYKGQRKGWGEILTDKAKVEKGSANCICELGYASTCPIHGDPDAIRELPPLWKWYVIDPGTPVSEIVQKYAWNIGEELNLNRVQVGFLGYFIQRRENAILSKARKEATAAALGHAWMTVQKISDDYCNDPEHGGIDPETGVWEGTEAQQSYVETLDQAVEAIRALTPAEASDLLAEVKRKERLAAGQIALEIASKHAGAHVCGAARNIHAGYSYVMRSCSQNMADEIFSALSAPQHEKQP